MNTTARDSKMMETLGRFGVLSTDQLARMFFPGTALTTVRRRLRLLEDEGLIYRVRGLDAGGVAWALTKKTARDLGSVYPARSFSRNSINHDVALSEVRNVLEEAGVCTSWVPEHVLKAQAMQSRSPREKDRPFVPDAIFSAQQGAHTRVIALELELTGKSSKRYENILGRYRKKKSIWAVWYLVPTESLGKSLEKVWKRINSGVRNDLLMWSTLDSLLQDPREVRVRNEHFSYFLRELVQMRPPAPSAALLESRAREPVTPGRPSLAS